jgi:UDP-3-O-[3-hydroxymyristoyl] glucosamine N-acyltransferase
MPDPRFFEDLGPARLGDLAYLTGAGLARAGEAERWVQGVSVLSRAGPDEIAFVADARHGEALTKCGAGACFLEEAMASDAPAGCALLFTAAPQAAWSMAAERLCRPRRHVAGESNVDSTAELEEGVIVGPGAVIGPRAVIGAGTYLAPGAIIGPGVAIGRDCSIGPGASVAFALIGDRVKIYAGAVIGEPGFGAAAGPKGLVDIPQLGRVIIQDGVTVGAGSCIDRGAFEDTTVGENTKIDNLVQIAHNVVIGRNCVLAAYAGVSGSAVIGDGCQLGGRVGIVDHIKIGAGARIAAGSGVMSQVPAGETWGGSPARPLKQWLRELAWVSRMARRRTGGA